MCCDTATRQAAHLGLKATIHRTHLGSLSSFLADVKRSDEITAG